MRLHLGAEVTFHLIRLVWYHFHRLLPNNAAHITAKVLKTHFLLVSFPPSPPSSFPPRNSVMFNNELMADVHFMVGQPGRTQRLPGHRVRNFTKRRGGNYQKTAKTKQSRRWPRDDLPSAAAATGLRTPLCATLTSTPRASSRRSSIINANEAEGAEGRGGEGGGG